MSGAKVSDVRLMPKAVASDRGVTVARTGTSPAVTVDDPIAAVTSGVILTIATDPDVLLADTADVLTAGFATTVYNAGTKTTGTYTPNEALGNMQRAVNGGAHTLAPPTNDGTMIIQYTPAGSAGTITTSGFTINYRGDDGSIYENPLYLRIQMDGISDAPQ
jgi:hypothetical protein